MKSKNTIRLVLIYHRQNRTEMTSANIYTEHASVLHAAQALSTTLSLHLVSVCLSFFRPQINQCLSIGTYLTCQINLDHELHILIQNSAPYGN
jgi:hypothetical protein